MPDLFELLIILLLAFLWLAIGARLIAELIEFFIDGGF